MDERTRLHQTARQIFEAAIAEAQRLQSALLPIKWDGSALSFTITGSSFDLKPNGNVYAIAIGKAASEMAAALDRKLGDNIKAGLVAVPHSVYIPRSQLAGWRTFTGGHPLPNQESLAAAQAAFALLEQANREEAVVIFLISGGGSAVMEWPADDRITLNDLREANRLLVSCGATIGEINAVRRTLSAVKGGKLAARAPYAHKATLIVSDVNRGEESNVASGPTFAAPANAPDPREVVERYDLGSSLPAAVMAAVREASIATSAPIRISNHTSHVLVDNQSVIEAAAENWQAERVPVEIAIDICEQPIAAGCELLLARVDALLERSRKFHMPACLISGGEFSCPVQGNGIGGRNLETALRWAIALDQRHSNRSIGRNAFDDSKHIVLLSAGSDGIDGNSRAAGAIADETTVARGRSLGLDAEEFLNNSDAFNYFDALGDAIITGATGTNVRDVRVILVST